MRDPILKAELADENKLTVNAIEEMLNRFLKNVKDGSLVEKRWPEIWPDYSVSKLALMLYSRLLAKTHQWDGVNVNCYCPGFTKTDMTHGVGSHTADEAAEVAVQYILTTQSESFTGLFFKWSTKVNLPSKI